MHTGTYSLDSTWRLLLKDLGIAPANVLRRAGLPDDLLERPDLRLSSTEYYRLWNGIEAEAPGPDLPVRMCQAVRSETFSAPIFAALCSPNLLVAARRIARFKELIAPMRLDMFEQETTLDIDLVWLEKETPPPSTLVMMELMMSVAIARIGTRERVCPISVTTTTRLEHADEYEAYLGVRVDEGDVNRITFGAADVQRPFLTSNPLMWDTFEPALRQRLADLEHKASTVHRVRAALLEGLPSGEIAIESIAHRLALSKRTLQRRIEEEGSSYQDILAQTRKSLADHYLNKTVLPVPEISFLLGFEEPNSFYRAFRAWTGSTPERSRAGISRV